MLIFARLGVMKNNQDELIFCHFPIILGHFFHFSSKKQMSGTAKTTQMTKEKIKLT